MSRTATTSLLQRCFDAFNAGDHDLLLECVADDVALDLNRGRREIGKDKLRWFLALRMRHFEDRVADIAVMTDEGGGRAAAEFTLRGRYVATAEGLPPASGQTYSAPAGMFLEIDDGLITRASVQLDLDDFVARLSRG